MKHQILSYESVCNVGDAVQHIAMTELLQRIQPDAEILNVDRARCDLASEDSLFIVNGWLGENCPGCGVNTLFAGVFVATPDNFQWIRRSRFPVGARDPATRAAMARRGIDAEFVGCATMTLRRFDGERAGVYSVDAGSHSRGMLLTHNATPGWGAQLVEARRLLDVYRSAELVITSRLHVALPCLAFGTPVIVIAPVNSGDTLDRFTLLDALGVRYGRESVIDVRWWSERYETFIKEIVSNAAPVHRIPAGTSPERAPVIFSPSK